MNMVIFIVQQIIMKISYSHCDNYMLICNKIYFSKKIHWESNLGPLNKLVCPLNFACCKT